MTIAARALDIDHGGGDGADCGCGGYEAMQVRQRTVFLWLSTPSFQRWRP